MTSQESLRYRLISANWRNGLLAIRQIELFVKTAWLTREQADAIYELPRRPTELVQADPMSPEILAEIKLSVNAG